MADSHASTLRTANNALLAEGKLDAVGDYFTPDFIAHLTGTEMTGQDSIRRYISMLRKAFPTLEVNVEILVDSGDRVSWQRKLRGKHEGDCQGFPPTGREVVWRDMLVSRFDGDRIAEEWVISDLAEQLLRQRN